MKIVQLAPLTLAVACTKASDHYDYEYPVPQIEAMGAAFLVAALAIFAPDTDEQRTFAHLWRVWAPTVYRGYKDGEPVYDRMPVPPEYAD